MKHAKICLSLLAVIALTGADTRANDAHEPTPGEGVFCALAISSTMAEIGKQCFPGQDQEFQTDMSRAVVKLDKFVLENSEMTQDTLTQFKIRQGGVQQPKATLCSAEMLQFYRSTAKRGAIFDGYVEKLVSRPGKPTWGDCL